MKFEVVEILLITSITNLKKLQILFRMAFKAKANQERAEQAQSRAGEETERWDGLLVRDHGEIIHCIRSCKEV